jgi:hypothetical protein
MICGFLRVMLIVRVSPPTNFPSLSKLARYYVVSETWQWKYKNEKTGFEKREREQKIFNFYFS